MSVGGETQVTKSEPEKWWKSATLYQIYPLSFADSNGDGWGDLPGITERLDYVASLGVDGIWLSPFYRSAWTDYGYDTIDHKQVDPRCGTIEDFDALLEKAHKLRLKVIIDQVYTYTSNRHPWFMESRAEPQGPKGDWYVWAPPNADGSVPNNWISIFGGPAWSWDMARRQYYMTHFLHEMPHLKSELPEVQEELLAIARFWLDRGVDGFRLNVINLAVVDQTLRDNPTSGEKGVILPAHAQQPLYNESRPEVLEFVRRLRSLADQHPDRFLLGEIAGRDPMDMAKRYTKGQDALHSAYFVIGADQEPLTAARVRMELESWSREGEGWPTWSVSNHDIVRAVTRCGHESAHKGFAELLLALIIAARGTALLYQGDELGLPDAQLPYEDIRDPASRRFYPEHLQRDGARTPMAWDGYRPGIGFTDGNPWLPVPETHRSLAVAQQENENGSTLELTRALISLRKRHPALGLGSVRFEELPDPIIAFTRKHGAETIYCAFNISDAPVEFTWPELTSGTTIIGHSDTPTSDNKVALGAFGFTMTRCNYDSV